MGVIGLSRARVTIQSCVALVVTALLLCLGTVSASSARATTPVSTAPSGIAVAGDDVTWTITVADDGPSDSVTSEEDPIVVTDVLAEGTTFVAAGSSEACSAAEDDPQTVTCLITETIAAGQSVDLDLVVAIDEDLSGELVNSATAVPGATADPDLSNNTDSDTVSLTEIADLSVAKTVTTDAADIVAGRQIAWAVTVTNDGPSDSDASEDDPIRVIDTLPRGVSYVSATGVGWTCAQGEVTADGRETIACARAETLPVGDAPVIALTGLVGPDVQGEIRNDVAVAPALTPEPDGSAANNTAHADAAVSESADLLLSKAVSQDIVAGDGGEYTLTVSNLGPSAARGVSLVDTLPDGLAFAGASGEGWTCTERASDASQIDCAYRGMLAPAGTLSLVMAVTADETLEGDIVNTAVVSAATPDPDLGNNAATRPGRPPNRSTWRS